MEESNSRWIDMQVKPWSSIVLNGMPVNPECLGSRAVGFCLVYASEEDAREETQGELQEVVRYPEDIIIDHDPGDEDDE